MAEDEYWVKRTTSITPAGIALAVITAGPSGARHWYGEYFVIITGENPKIYAQRTMLNASQVPEDMFPLNYETMRTEIEQQVQTILSIHLHNIQESSSNELLRGLAYTLEESEKTDLLRLWLRGECHEQIKYIRNRTQCGPLNEYLSDVIHLEPFHREET